MPKRIQFSHCRIHDFLDELGSDAVSPGGGSAAALVSAAGAALLEMVCRLNNKRQRRLAGWVSSRNARRAARVRGLRFRLTRLVSEDALAFQRLMELKKEGGPYERALKKSAQVPFEICVLSERLMRLAGQETARTSRWLTSDLVEAIAFLRAGFLGGKLNVEANLFFFKAGAHARRVRRSLKKLQGKMLSR